MIIFKKYIKSLIFLFFLGEVVFAENYYSHYDDQSRYDDRHRPSSAESSGYEEAHPYQRGYSRHYDTQPEYQESQEGYYSCPRGDYISDRPGRCPLDGSVLIPRGSSYGSRARPYSGTYSDY